MHVNELDESYDRWFLALNVKINSSLLVLIFNSQSEISIDFFFILGKEKKNTTTKKKKLKKKN